MHCKVSECKLFLSMHVHKLMFLDNSSIFSDCASFLHTVPVTSRILIYSVYVLEFVNLFMKEIWVNDQDCFNISTSFELSTFV